MNSTKRMIEQTSSPEYFRSLTITNVKCFKGEQTINLSDNNDKPALWTVILGNNNTGKTTLLRCLADLEPVAVHIPNKEHEGNKERVYCPKVFNKNIPYDGLDYPLHYKIQCEFSNTKSRWFCSVDIPSKDSVSKKASPLPSEIISNIIIYGYGTSRRIGGASLSEAENKDNTASLFSDDVSLTNVEEWLLQTFFAEKLNKPNAAKILNKIKKVLTSGILPDVQDFDFDTTNNFQGFVKIKTDYGWVKLQELGYGYQVTLAWVVDLAKKLFERYPDSDNPLHEPAIVLVDEIDLHLHPEWQRKIIGFLSEQFPHTQFIATTHSPLVVQSAENINLVLLEKERDHVIIKQPNLTTYKGWTVEEILSDLMGLEGKTKSEDYLSLIKEFNKAVAKNDYLCAKEFYDRLNVLLHPNNIHRELLSLQLNSLTREAYD